MSLEISNVSVAASGAPILTSVSLTVGDHERVGLIGASGSGKSMLATSVMGLMPSNVTVRGSALLDGQELVGLSPHQFADIRGRSVGFVFQDPLASLNPVVPVGTQIAAPLKRHYSLGSAERRSRVEAMLEKVGLEPRLATAYPHELSGGQAQRAAIACALITSPRLIIADEPTTALDAMTQVQITHLLSSLVDDAGASLLFITHDFSVLARVAQRCYVLGAAPESARAGSSTAGSSNVGSSNVGSSNVGSSIVESGETHELLAHPRSAAGARLVEAARRLSFSAQNADQMPVPPRSHEGGQL
ncbi:MAG: ABC transporter ATP-binding protein [Bifidobacteriaceae bacterium]|jgi:peptide/nickel transport system ATP-binding protein|nr:ABC transporter ATP-binding protein [Bifidobacteriaceae bacterium]